MAVLVDPAADAEGDDVILTADAAFVGSGSHSVEFFGGSDGTTSLGTVNSTAPWSVTDTQVLAGTHLYRIKVDGGAYSPGISVTIPPEAPTLALPADEFSVTIGNTLSFRATGVNPLFDGATTTKIEFYVGGVLRATCLNDVAGDWDASWDTTGATPAVNQSVVARRYYTDVAGATQTVDSTAAVDGDIVSASFTPFASVGSLGTGVGTVAATTTSVASTALALAAGDYAVLAITCDNVSATGNTNDVTGCTYNGVAMTKLGERTYSPGSPGAGTGITVALFGYHATGVVASGVTITATHANVTARAMKGWKFTADATSTTTADGSSSVDGAAVLSPASDSATGAQNVQHLWIRVMGRERAANIALNVTAGWTDMGVLTNGGATAAGCDLYCSFTISTGTGSGTNSDSITTGTNADWTSILRGVYQA